MNLTSLLRQTVAWQTISSVNSRDDKTFGPAQNVRCRKSMVQNDIIGKDGEVTTSMMTVLMFDEPGIGDLLDGREVINVSSSTDFNGIVVGYLVKTR